GWQYQAQPHGNPVWSPHSELHQVVMQPGILEGFGALQLQARPGQQHSHGSGGYLAIEPVRSGWGLVGLGGTTQGSNGWGRLLNGILTWGGVRSSLASSKASGSPVSGTTSTFHMEARKRPGSHGMCSTGGKLSAYMDECV